MIDNFENSITTSEIIDGWMDKYVYSTSAFTDFHRYTYADNVEAQNKGLDVTFSLNGINYKTDEKCASEYVNKNLMTFAFAVSQTNRDDRTKRHYDWFVREDMLNDSYLIQYIDLALNEDGGKQDKYTITEDGIKQMTLILVRKDKIYEFLAEHNLTKDKIYSGNQYMLDNKLSFYPYGECNKWMYSWRFHRDFKYVEQTINILIKKTDLIKISDWHATIRR